MKKTTTAKPKAPKAKPEFPSTLDLVEHILSQARSLEKRAHLDLERAATHRAMANSLLRGEFSRSKSTQ